MANWPTVLFSWWCTSFAAAVIITRLLSRKVRSNKLFREDWIMMASLVPLFLRMVFIHFVLIYGTNNIDVSNIELTGTRLRNHEMGARLVLAGRIFYAMFLWTCKFTMSEFLKRITIRVWRRSWELTLQGIRIFLGVTFFAVVAATLSECQPFEHYWQVIPDPGPHCRQGFGNLLTMGTCDIVTDILLIAFPVPVVLNSGQTWKRKAQMISLFSMSAVMIAITATRMPMVIGHQGRQQYRTVWASCEILAAAAVSNAVILGSFLRDKGTKKRKYRTFSISDSIDRASVRRPTLPTLHDVDSDEDLFRSLGCRVPAHLQTIPAASPRLAPPALPAPSPNELLMTTANVQRTNRELDSDSDDSLVKPVPPHALPVSTQNQELSFFDIGNLLEENERSIGSRSRSTIVDSGDSAVAAQDFATYSTPRSSRPGSRTFLHDVGGILSSRRGENHERGSSRHNGRTRTAPTGILGPMLERHETQVSLQDAGGLLESTTPQTHSSLSANEYGHTESNSQRIRMSFHRTAARSHTRQYLDHEGIELEDIDDDLFEKSRVSRGAMTLQEALAHNRNHDDNGTGRDLAVQHQQPDDMVLHDPGGLARSS